jgi:L-amino acid N-acyltransferase YncA
MNFSTDALRPSDWNAVRAIYREGIAMRNATFATAAPDWERWDAAHLPFARLVARAGDSILGWAALSPVSRRACYAGVAEASIYVAQKHWRRGVGRALLAALIEASEKNGV